MMISRRPINNLIIRHNLRFYSNKLNNGSNNDRSYRDNLDDEIDRQEDAVKTIKDDNQSNTLPYLPRALGVVDKPLSIDESWTQRSKNYFTEAKLEERKRLL